jgi:hypothetical protein
MNKISILKVLCMAIVISAAAISANSQVTSKYTSLREKDCRKLKVSGKDNIIYHAVCNGVAGYKLELFASEEHEWVEIVTPKGKHFDVSTQSASYNHLDNKAEWRMRRALPIGLIIRYNIMNPEVTKVDSSPLIVSKVAKNSACVVDIVDGSKTQNTRARQLADSAAGRPCRATD